MQIYALTNKKTGKIYIGQTVSDINDTSARSRRYAHLKDLRRGVHDNQELQMDWVRHNCKEDDLEFEVLMELDDDTPNVTDIESDIITEYREKYPGRIYNVILPRKTQNKYTTIQMNRDTHTAVKEFCNNNGRSISGMTEVLWMSYLTASMGA